VIFDIRTALLDPEDADRLYKKRPELKAGPDDYCPTCNKTGKFRWRGEDHDCDCRMQLSLAKHYSAAGIGVTYQRLDWSDFEGHEELCHQVLKYLEDHQSYISRGVGLLFHGPIGSGKTLVANLMLKELIKRGYTGFATTFSNTIEAFTSTWGNKDNKEWFAQKFMYSKMLLLDDLGRELRTGVNLAQSTFDMILRTRVSEGRPTILTTNSTPGELGSGYGAQVLSLIVEQSIAHEFTGIDWRSKANERTRAEIKAGEVRPLV
jgi:DNA replication protein DnaC